MAQPILAFYSPTQFSTNTAEAWDMRTQGSQGYDPGIPTFEIGGSGEITFSFTGMAEGWIRFCANIAGNFALANRPLLTLRGPTSDLLQVTTVTASGTSALRFEYWNGSSWVQIGSDVTGWEATPLDIHWDIDGASGVFELYRTGSLVASVSGDTLHTADTTIGTAAFKGTHTTTAYVIDYYGIFVDSVDTRGLFWAVDEPSSAGQYATMTGTYTSVDDYPFENNAQLTYLVADAAGEKFSANFGTIHASLSAGVIETVVMLAWAKANAEPGLYLKPLLRLSSTDYNPTGSIQPQSTRDYCYGVNIPLNPATGAAWANAAAVQSFQMGWEASATA